MQLMPGLQASEFPDCLNKHLTSNPSSYWSHGGQQSNLLAVQSDKQETQ